jgi:hypothetical protein
MMKQPIIQKSPLEVLQELEPMVEELPEFEDAQPDDVEL